SEPDEEADRLGQLIGARVTFIAPDGRVLGDSSETLGGVAAMENHGQRPEVVAARETGLGRSRRYSSTVKIDMLYIAVPVKHPAIGFVRVALPLTDVRHQLQPVLTATLAALSLALLGGAVIAWLLSARRRSRGGSGACSPGGRGKRCSFPRRATRREPSWPRRRRQPARSRTASSSCCTTSRSSGASIRSAATSLPTSRTSCERR